MAYLLKQKFKISELVPNLSPARRILLVEPEYYVKHVYLKHLKEHGYEPFHSANLSDALLILKNMNADAAILNPHAEDEYKNFISRLSVLRNLYPSLPVITVGQSLPVSILSEIMALGVISHLEKRLTRPGDIITVIKTILQN